MSRNLQKKQTIEIVPYKDQVLDISETDYKMIITMFKEMELNCSKVLILSMSRTKV